MSLTRTHLNVLRQTLLHSHGHLPPLLDQQRLLESFLIFNLLELHLLSLLCSLESDPPHLLLWHSRALPQIHPTLFLLSETADDHITGNTSSITSFESTQ